MWSCWHYLWSHLLHVPVVHGIVRHLVGLQFDDLLQLVAVSFPLTNDHHFIEEENVPVENTVTVTPPLEGQNYSPLPCACRFWTHRSCLVLLRMEQTFSSPSILGRPYSSSLTCCLGSEAQVWTLMQWRASGWAAVNNSPSNHPTVTFTFVYIPILSFYFKGLSSWPSTRMWSNRKLVCALKRSVTLTTSRGHWGQLPKTLILHLPGFQ